MMAVALRTSAAERSRSAPSPKREMPPRAGLGWVLRGIIAHAVGGVIIRWVFSCSLHEPDGLVPGFSGRLGGGDWKRGVVTR